MSWLDEVQGNLVVFEVARELQARADASENPAFVSTAGLANLLARPPEVVNAALAQLVTDGRIEMVSERPPACRLL